MKDRAGEREFISPEAKPLYTPPRRLRKIRPEIVPMIPLRRRKLDLKPRRPWRIYEDNPWIPMRVLPKKAA